KDALAAAIAGLEEKEVEEPTALDKSALEDLIAKAKEISNDDDKYTKTSFASLQAAIEHAEDSLEAIETEDELNEALDALQAAIDGLKEIDKDVEEDSVAPIVDKDKGGGKLPGTGTQMYNWLLIGVSLLLIGSISYTFLMKRNKLVL